MKRYEVDVLEPQRFPASEPGTTPAAAFDQAWGRVPIRDGAWRGRGVLDTGRQDELLFIKGLRIPLLRKISRWIQRWCIHNEYRHLVELRRAGIDVPEPVAWGSEWAWGLPRRSFLVTRWIRDAPDLQAWLGERTGGGRRLTGRDREALLAVGRLVRRLHERGFVHGDLAARNLLVCETGPSPRVVLIDPARARASEDRRRRRIDQLRLAKTSMKAGLCREDAVALMDAASGGSGEAIVSAMLRMRAIRSRSLRKLRYRVWFRFGR